MESINKTKKQLKGLVEQANNLVKSGDIREKAEGQGMLTVICFMQNNLENISNEFSLEVSKNNRCYI